jgi:hypothetical protein
MKPRFSRLVEVLCIAAVATVAMGAHAAWPPAPGADMRDKQNWPNDFNGRWNYLSYFPERPASARPIAPFDQKLGAAGMSIDRAWTYTIGRSDTKIAVIDSGIQWDNADLVNKAALNLGELKRDEAKPKKSDGSACGGAGALAGYDCDGDGRFNVADYRDDPRVTPVVAGEPCFKEGDKKKPGGDRIKGDLNRNCVLDPGDVILMFSDGVDDDANGYTDDICGWDFLKNDNDPYDDTRYGHGTGEARDSAAEANNGDGDPGVCPLCTFIPLRVGESFIGDANDFAKAVVYAADNGAKVVQEALGTLNQTTFSKAAIDYAYTKGAIVMASMADENSRHHNMPATANHVLTVHSIRYDESNPTQATTFVAFDTCSNYGGHLSLSVSATSCSSEATGRSSGIAGLAQSLATEEGLTLTAEELIQLFKMEADDIDVPGSGLPGSSLYASQTGFDQRFGYGRANAVRMMEAIKARHIPPEVDIVSPEWFAPIHAEGEGGPIQIMGRVTAQRAQSYDFKVQWAPGVQPLEGEYRDVVAPLTNIPGSTVTGGATPLAQLDPAQLDTAHPRDPDSPMGENDRSISIRVRAVAHYAGYDVAGEARRVVSITNQKNGLDADLLPGFPIALGASAEASPKLADVDGDGIRDIVQPDSSGRIHVYTMKSGRPAELPGFPYHTRPIDGIAKDLTSEPTVPNYLSAPAYAAGTSGGGIDPEIAREAVMAAPAVADIDGDGKPEIVVVAWPGTVYVLKSSGQDLAGWPKRLPLVPSCPYDPNAPQPERCMELRKMLHRGSYSAPVVVDMDRDGRPEIVLTAFDGQIWVFKSDASVLDGFPVPLESPASDAPSRSMATPTVADLNGDGIPEIIAGSNQQIGGGGAAGPVFVVDGRGTKAPSRYLPNWPMTVSSLKLFPVVAEGIVASEAAGDFDGDGRADIVIQGNGSRPLIMQADPGPQASLEEPPNRLPVVQKDDGTEGRGLEPTSNFGELTKAFQPDVMFPLFSQPSIGDVDQDGVLDVIASGGSLSLAGALAGAGVRAERAQQLLAVWSGKTGKMLPASPMLVEDYTFLMNHAVADLSGDDYPEVITGSAGYFLHAVDGCGREAPGFPKFTNGWIAATAAVGDIDGDAQKSLEVVVGTREGYLFAWKTHGRESGVVQWESFHHDNANTGNYGTKLAQGTLQRAAEPLVCAEDAKPAGDAFDLGGGCACRASGRTGAGSLSAVVATLGALALLRRRRAARA